MVIAGGSVPIPGFETYFSGWRDTSALFTSIGDVKKWTLTMRPKMDIAKFLITKGKTSALDGELRDNDNTSMENAVIQTYGSAERALETIQQLLDELAALYPDHMLKDLVKKRKHEDDDDGEGSGQQGQAVRRQALRG